MKYLLRGGLPPRSGHILHENHTVGHSRAKLISWVTTNMVMRSLASSRITPSTSWVSSGSRALVGLPAEISVHASARGRRHPLLPPPEKLIRVLVRLVGEADLGKQARVPVPWPARGKAA